MAVVSFKILGWPQPKARARMGKGIVYTPQKTAKWERDIAIQAKQYAPPEPWDCAIRMQAIFILSRPKSVPRSRCSVYTKPDLSNLLKSIEDALEGIIFVNDSRIVAVDMFKRYVRDGEEPGVEVLIAQVDDDGF